MDVFRGGHEPRARFGGIPFYIISPILQPRSDRTVLAVVVTLNVRLPTPAVGAFHARVYAREHSWV